MALIIQKYGGTSIGDLQKVDAVATRIIQAKKLGNKIVVVVSAMAGETRRLDNLAKQITPQCNPRELDALLVAGEQMSVALLAIALINKGCPAVSLSGSQLGIITDSNHNAAQILKIDPSNILQVLDSGKICVVAGFQGVDANGNTTTLGFEGSDTTAVALAAALQADECQIYTDVPGIHTGDPKIIPQARQLENINIQQMLELSGLGAQILHHTSVAIAEKHKVPLKVLSSATGDGTVINHDNGNNYNFSVISGIACNKKQMLVTAKNINYKLSNNIISQISARDITIDMLTLEQSALVFAVDSLFKAKINNIYNDFLVTDGLAKISVVGSNLRSDAKIINTIFATLDSLEIEIKICSTSEMRISILIDTIYLEQAVNAIHGAFNLAELEEIITA